jgi:hypothetical protein
MTNLNRHDQLCSIAARSFGCTWNDFEVLYQSQNSLMIRLDGNKAEYLLEFSQNDTVIAVYSE